MSYQPTQILPRSFNTYVLPHEPVDSNPQAFNTILGNLASTNSVANGNCYMDSRKTHHFTTDLTIVDLTRPFTRGHQITVDNGKKLHISHIGHASLATHPHLLSLTNSF